jgi:hypothetical protein
MAAEVLAGAGLRVDVYDAMPSVARKFLLAGRGGLNLTHSEAPKSSSRAMARAAKKSAAGSTNSVRSSCALGAGTRHRNLRRQFRPRLPA